MDDKLKSIRQHEEQVEHLLNEIDQERSVVLKSLSSVSGSIASFHSLVRCRYFSKFSFSWPDGPETDKDHSPEEKYRPPPRGDPHFRKCCYIVGCNLLLLYTAYRIPCTLNETLNHNIPYVYICTTATVYSRQTVVFFIHVWRLLLLIYTNFRCRRVIWRKNP
jgi:hypothetical protein